MGSLYDAIFGKPSVSELDWDIERRLDCMMGMAAQQPPLPTPQQWLNSAAAQSGLGSLQGQLGQNTYQSDLLFSMNPVTTSMNAKLLQLSTMLPMKLLLEIDNVTLRENPLRIEIRFKAGKIFAIDDVDKFPSEEHAARIALECP